jgi:hypothetical protein
MRVAFFSALCARIWIRRMKSLIREPGDEANFNIETTDPLRHRQHR